MAITATQKAKIIDYLGYPGQTWVLNWVNQRIGLLPSSELETEVENLVTQISDLETTRQSFLNLNLGKQIDGVTRDSFYRGQFETDCEKRIHDYKRRLSNLLQINLNQPPTQQRGQS